MTLSSIVLISLLSLAAPLNTGPLCNPQTGQTVQGTKLYCCTLSSGLQCCAETLAEDGTVSGCGCTP